MLLVKSDAVEDEKRMDVDERWPVQSDASDMLWWCEGNEEELAVGETKLFVLSATGRVRRKSKETARAQGAVHHNIEQARWTEWVTIAIPCKFGMRRMRWMRRS